MKRLIAILTAVCCINTSVLAATRTEQSEELHSLIDACEKAGLSVEYEKSATAVFDHYIPLEETDSSNDSLPAEQKNYNSQSMTKIYNETKSKLESYIAGTAKPLTVPEVTQDGIRNISGNIFTDSNGEPLYSMGFGHEIDVFYDEDVLKTIGSRNIQVEAGPLVTTLPTGVYLWKVLHNNDCDADVNIIENDGNKSLNIVNRSTAGDNQYILISQIVPVEPNQRYVYSFDAVSEGAHVAVFLGGFDNRQPDIWVDTTKTTYKPSKFFTTGSDQYYMNFMMAFDYGAPIEIDNIALTNMKTKENAIKNGDFEGEGNYYFHLDIIEDKLNAIKSISQKGYAVDLLLSPHYVPPHIKEAYPELFESNTSFGFFNISHPEYRKLLKDYIEFIMSVSKGCGIDSICLSNEPNYCSSAFYDYYNPLFREWMQNKYNNNIANLNTAHGKSYSSFDNVNIPSYLKNAVGWPQADPMFYDYTLFNEEIFADWHKMMAETVKSVCPDMPVHAKMQDYLFFYDTYSPAKMLFGTDAELFSEFCDIAGNDATTYVSIPESRLGTMMWYDFLSSTTGKPVYNSEDHVILDYNDNFSDEEAHNVRYELLNGALHGLGASSLWEWGRLMSFTTLFSYFPYATYKTGQTMLDLRRVNNELAAFVTDSPDTAFFYSKASRVMKSYEYEDSLQQDYAAVTALGHKTGFVTERHPEKLSQYKTLILPNVQYLPETSVSEIADFMRNGGHVIIEGSSPMAYTEYGVAASTNDRTYIKNNAYYVSSRTAEAFNAAYAHFGEQTSFVYENTAVAQGIDLKIAEYDGNSVIALTNVTDNDKTVTVLGSEKYTNLYDMAVYSNEITLKPYEPMLLLPIRDSAHMQTEAVFNQNTVSFKIDYSYTSDIKMSVVAVSRNGNGSPVGIAYSERNLSEGVLYTLSGTVNAKDAETVDFVLYNTDTKEIISSRTITK